MLQFGHFANTIMPGGPIESDNDGLENDKPGLHFVIYDSNFFITLIFSFI